MAEAQVVGVPQPMEMEQGGATDVNGWFGGEGLTVKQTMKGCFQECCGCEAESEYKIGPYQGDFEEGTKGVGTDTFMYALEESNFCFRLCCPSMRPLEINVSAGAEKGGAKIASYRKGWSFPLCFSIPTQNGTIDCPCCCFMPGLTAHDASGKEIGSAKYICDACLLVPKFGYYENEQMVYYLAPETCCGGACMVFKCGGTGGKAIYQPFYFRDPVTKEKLDNDKAGIAKLWSGLKKECCSDADNFALKWPTKSTLNQRMGLLGLNFLVDLVWFETHK